MLIALWVAWDGITVEVRPYVLLSSSASVSLKWMLQEELVRVQESVALEQITVVRFCDSPNWKVGQSAAIEFVPSLYCQSDFVLCAYFACRHSLF